MRPRTREANICNSKEDYMATKHTRTPQRCVVVIGPLLSHKCSSYREAIDRLFTQSPEPLREQRSDIRREDMYAPLSAKLLASLRLCSVDVLNAERVASVASSWQQANRW